MAVALAYASINTHGYVWGGRGKKKNLIGEYSAIGHFLYLL
jgi:hypothetical protein